jgi:polysaccharide pyruvyl transferase WcaK-like protein
VSLNPYSYLNIISNGSLTLSTRVHACVTALSYQKPTMLFQKTKRSFLFERLGLQDIINKPVTLAREKLEIEHEEFKKFLKPIDI